MTDLEIVKLNVKIPFKYRRLFRSKTVEEFSKKVQKIHSLKKMREIKELFDVGLERHEKVMSAMRDRVKFLKEKRDTR